MKNPKGPLPYVPTFGSPTIAVCNFIESVVDEYVRPNDTADERVKDDVLENAATSLLEAMTVDIMTKI